MVLGRFAIVKESLVYLSVCLCVYDYYDDGCEVMAGCVGEWQGATVGETGDIYLIKEIQADSNLCR